MPKSVMTVLGLISTGELGPTLSHEHVLAALPGYESDSTLVFDREGALLVAVERLTALKAAGISSFIDPIPIDLGRRVDFIADVAAACGMNIICATGLYTERAGFPAHYRRKSVEEIAELYVTEITQGIGPRKIRPGVIKCATSANEILPNERKALAAAARASKATGVPITTHTEEGTMGPQQLDIFEAEGLDPKRVTIGHCSDTADLSYLVAILKRGAYIGFDRVGLELSTTDDLKVGAVSALVAMGYQNQIVLSHDSTCYVHGFEAPPAFAWGPKRQFTYIPKEFIPRMKAAGIGEHTIHTMMVGNPRRYFEGSG